MDRNELKVQALLEKISTLTTQYENQVAELRIDLTLLAESNRELLENKEALETRVAELEAEGAKPVKKAAKKAASSDSN